MTTAVDTRGIDEVLRREVDSGAVPNVVAVAADRDGPFYEGAAGNRTFGTDQPLDGGTLFRIASMTKMVATTAALQLVERGELDLQAPIDTLVPQWSQLQVLEGWDGDTPRTRPPADDDAEHVLVRTVRCLSGSVEIELVCEPVFDYGRMTAEWSLADDRHSAAATGAGQAIQLSTDMLIGIEGGRARARHVLHAGEELYCALAWGDDTVVPGSFDEARGQLDATTRFWHSWLARARIPDSSPSLRKRANDERTSPSPKDAQASPLAP